MAPLSLERAAAAATRASDARRPEKVPGVPGPGVAAVLLLALLFAFTQYPGLLRVPFVGDDYFSLDKTRDASVAVVWAPRDLVSHWYRPWSRELHYWVLQRLFGTRVAPWHAVSVALWAGVMALYFALVRRLAGARAAAVATAAVMALAGWGVLVVWVQGAQDLWMMLFALACLLAVARGSIVLACAAQALALLSKETAALLPLMAFVLEWLVMGHRPARALRRAAPLAVVAIAWAAFHPLLGGRLWLPRSEPALPGIHPALHSIAAHSLLSMLNLHAHAAPMAGWRVTLPTALIGMAIVLALAAWGLIAREPRAAVGRAGSGAPASLEGGAQPRAAAVDEAMAHVAILGALWALLAWAPLLLPKLGWHAYYALFGALGAWLALALGLARWRWLAPVLIGCLALARAGLATTPTSDWGTEWFQRRAAAFTEDAHAALSRLRPALPPHSRVFFAGVPGSIGLVPGGEESPPLRVWYRDRTLRAASLERYRPRPAGDTSGQDVFFRFDPEVGWREIVKGEEDVAAARARAPRWRADHEQLAIALARGRDWNGTCAEYLKLAGAYPEDPAYAYYTGLALAVLGDSVRSGEWIRRAAALPTADEEIRAAARGLGPVPGGRNGSTAPAAAGRAPRSSPATDRRGAPHAPIAPPGRRR